MEFLGKLRNDVPDHVLKIVDQVWNQRDLFVHWPQHPICFWPGRVRVPYHKYSVRRRARLRSAGITIDARSNGPAVMAFLLGGGKRPFRQVAGKQWSIHHIYDGKFPFPGTERTTHAVKNKKLFTHSAGLVAVHPIADALADEVAYFAWLLRHEAYLRFQFDPDEVFGSSRATA